MLGTCTKIYRENSNSLKSDRNIGQFAASDIFLHKGTVLRHSTFIVLTWSLTVHTKCVVAFPLNQLLFVRAIKFYINCPSCSAL